MKKFTCLLLSFSLLGCATQYDSTGRKFYKPIPCKISVMDFDLWSVHRPVEIDLLAIAKQVASEEMVNGEGDINTRSVAGAIAAAKVVAELVAKSFKYYGETRRYGSEHEVYIGANRFKLVTIEWGWEGYYLESMKIQKEIHQDYLRFVEVKPSL